MTAPAPNTTGAPSSAAGSRSAAAAGAAGTPAAAAAVAAAVPQPSGATRHAERAVVGALLRRPDRLRDVREWLRPEDFADPQLGQAYAAIESLHAQGRLHSVPEDELVRAEFSAETRSTIIGNALTVKDALADGPAGSARYGQLMHDVLAAAPTSAAPRHHRYAHIVLEGSFRRQIEQRAVHMRLLSISAASGEVAAIDPAQLRHDLVQMSNRLSRASGFGTVNAVDQPDLIPIPATSPPANLVERAEKRLIAAVLADLEHGRPDLRERFEPRDFSTPEHASTWRAILAVGNTELAAPIDPILVAFETEKISGNPGLDAEELLAMSRKPAPVNDATLSTVAQAALYRHGQEMATTMHAAANDRGRPIRDVVDTARSAESQLQRDAKRLTGRPAQTPLTRVLDDAPTPRPHPPAEQQPRGRLR
ncbi:DnaB-like helicase N-terminal domain-containing protein [Amycolatopsis anabasis]|uniref:DnaB-like helicase N-terminal domain-containing protein n=1 Tax=Amycolatopsis anabasis TaxID=1840409 RepID=UPI002483F36B|nr:DnaB-like helicase N-terminal domain-containing protein [Amycolatopsis anabasis]